MNTWIRSVLLLAVVAQSYGFYKNRGALDCFSNKGTELCGKYFDLCVSDKQCRNELQLYNRCSFGSGEQDIDHIFNGYCFRRWRELADHTSQVISCLNIACDFQHNSQIGLSQLYRCGEWIMFEENVECGDACLHQMSLKVGANVYQTSILKLYTQQFHNQEAQQLAKLILQECIEEGGKGKQMIYDEEKVMAEEEWTKIIENHNQVQQQIQPQTTSQAPLEDIVEDEDEQKLEDQL